MYTSLGTLRDDVSWAARSLRRSPGFVAVMVVSLALGVGAALSAFSILDAVRFRALPFPGGERLVVLGEVPVTPGAPPPSCGVGCDVSWLSFDQVVRPHAFRTLDLVVGYTTGGKVYMAGGEPVPVSGGVVTPNIFSMLGVRPLLGRAFTADDDRVGAPLVTMVSHAFWTNRLGSDSAVIGRVIKLSDSQYTVVGVMPPGFAFEIDSDFWLPTVPTLDPSTRPSIRSLTVVGRLAAGHTLADLRTELAALELPAARAAAGSTAMHLVSAPLRDRYVAATGSYDVMFAVMVACLLCLTVANLANLSLVRAFDQRREFSVQSALGAARGRLVRQLVLQYLGLGALGTGLGLLIARWLLALLSSVDALRVPQPAGMEPTLDARVMLFGAIVMGVVGGLLALAPAHVALTASRDSALRAAAGTAARRSMWQRVLVMIQLGGAFALLTCGALLTRSASRLAQVDLGFDAKRTVQGTPSFPHPWRVPETYVPVTERILDQLQLIPGVRRAAVRTTTALRGPAGAAIVLDGADAPLAGALVPAQSLGVSEQYFDVFGIPVVRGRAFTSSDVGGGVPVAIVNAWAAQRWWPGQDPVGRVVRVDTARGVGVSLTIVGVVADNRAAQSALLYADPGPELYRPWRQSATAFPTFVASAAGDPAALLKPVRDLLVREVPDRPSFASRSADGVEAQLNGIRTNAKQALWISAVGLLIALVGIYGVLSYIVRQRTREIGIRRALGATTPAVSRLVASDVAWMSAGGLALGVPAALGGARLIASLLFQVDGSDPITWLVVAAGLLAAAGLAATVPAIRALRIPALEACRD